jgi:hypothetical protein
VGRSEDRLRHFARLRGDWGFAKRVGAALVQGPGRMPQAGVGWLLVSSCWLVARACRRGVRLVSKLGLRMRHAALSWSCGGRGACYGDAAGGLEWCNGREGTPVCRFRSLCWTPLRVLGKARGKGGFFFDVQLGWAGAWAMRGDGVLATHICWWVVMRGGVVSVSGVSPPTPCLAQ